MTIKEYDEANKEFVDGTILSRSKADLQKHLLGIANQNSSNQTTQHRDVIRGITINHLLLQQHINDIDRKNTITQRWVMVLAIASLLGTAVQIFYAMQPVVPPAVAIPIAKKIMAAPKKPAVISENKSNAALPKVTPIPLPAPASKPPAMTKPEK